MWRVMWDARRLDCSSCVFLLGWKRGEWAMSGRGTVAVITTGRSVCLGD